MAELGEGDVADLPFEERVKVVQAMYRGGEMPPARPVGATEEGVQNYIENVRDRFMVLTARQTDIDARTAELKSSLEKAVESENADEIYNTATRIQESLVAISGILEERKSYIATAREEVKRLSKEANLGLRKKAYNRLFFKTADVDTNGRIDGLHEGLTEIKKSLSIMEDARRTAPTPARPVAEKSAQIQQALDTAIDRSRPVESREQIEKRLSALPPVREPLPHTTAQGQRVLDVVESIPRAEESPAPRKKGRTLDI